jgi:Tol biopolymer transport system component
MEAPMNPSRNIISVGVALVALVVTSAAASTPARSEQRDVPRLAFTSLRLNPGGPGESGLYVVNADGSGKRKVADNAWFLTPTWSPEGRIAFFGGPFDGMPEVYLVNADGSGLRNLTSEWGADGLPVWSPDGRRIAFASTRSDQSPGIYVMGADGKGRRQLTQDGAWPLWAPDGKRITFLRSHPAPTRPKRCCQIGPVDVYVMNADGSGQRRLTRNTVRDENPVWSPDVRKIACESKWQVWVVNADGSGQRRLTRNGARNFAPAWSPDGRRIVFVRRRDGNPDLYIMNADGSGQRRLTRTGTSEVAPAWSPDGRKIAFVRKRRGVSEEIHIMNANGSQQQRLSRSGVQPLWSPDGQFVTFTSARDGNREVYLVNADGSGEKNVSQNSLGDDAWPVWAPGQR